MTKRMTCPNCGADVVGHKENGCALATLIGVVRDRGNKTQAELHRLHADVDSDALWNDLGKIVDRLEDGEYESTGG